MQKAYAEYAVYRKQLLEAPSLAERHFIEVIKEIEKIEKKQPRNK
jgi:hypothetical protein